MTDKLRPTPFEMRHVTRVSLRHCVDAQAVTPTRTRPLQSEKPALLPCTDTLTCAVDGCRAGDTAETTRERKISGTTIFDCVCNGRPSAPKTDTLAMVEVPTALVKPGMRHTMADAGAAKADGMVRRSINGPFGSKYAGEIITFEMFKLEQAAPTAELLLKEANRKPVTDTVVKVTPAGIANAMVKATF